MRTYARGLATFLVSLMLFATAGCAPVIGVKKWATGQDRVEASRDVVVEVRLYGPRGPVGAGSGFVVDRRGLVVTNNHVVAAHVSEETKKPIVITNIVACVDVNKPSAACYKATVLATSPRDDLALLRVDHTFSATTRIGEPRTLDEGEEIFVRATIGTLIGSALVYGRYVGMSRTDELSTFDRPFLVLDVAGNPGGSGGPVFDRKRGELIGVLVMVTAFGGRSMSMAIPVATVVEFLEANDPYLQPAPPAAPAQKGH